MEATVQSQLVGSEIHGFKTMQDLDVRAMFEEAKTRWLRPNEIHAILCNHKYFNILVKPLNLPKSGTIVLFDRKMLRNFRRDGHNWKKKKDGKTVKEAHEHLKVGNDERIHVYYAHGDDQSTFVRRCYWLLDKKLEHIVLVHYRDTQELFEPIMQLQGSPTIESNSSSDPPTSWNLSEDNDVDQIYYAEPNETIINHEMRLREINTLEWDELVVPPDSNKLITTEGGNMSNVGQVDQYGLNGFVDTINGSNLQNITTFEHILSTDGQSANFQLGPKLVNTRNNILDDELKSQDSFGRWMNYTMTEYPVIVDPVLTPEPLVSVTSGYSNQLQKMFTITEVSPSWASTSEDTKILIVGLFHEDHLHLSNSKLFCVCGDISVPIEVVQSGVFRCYVSPRTPGIVNLFISQDGQKPISQLISFEYRAPPIQSLSISSEEKSDWEDFHVKMRLAHLLFSTSRSLNILSSKVPPKTLKEAKIFAHKTRSIVESWDLLINSITEKKISFSRAKTSLLELTLQNRLLEWLLERILEGNKIPERDDEGQGVIHLCAILDYTWAIFPYSSSGLSIDFRDKFGWTALHWAAHNGRQRSVASLLSAGANPNLVTDPTSENPGGCTPADLASKSGYEGLAAFLAEKALLAHFEAMTLAGNVSSSLQCTIPTDDRITNGSGTNVTEEEQYLKDTLAAYRRAADAAARIQAAFREQSFKMKAKAAEFANAEDEARCIIAAMKIQHAYRKHETKKQMKAAVHIQHRFRTWKIRKDFLNKRRQVIKIQAYFRGFQVRRQYKKIIWSVGVLEKAIIRWRLRRKGLRGLQVAPNNDDSEENEKEEKVGEENFFHASRKQAEERVERSVIRVQAMFRSKKAQEEYRKMKIALNESSLEYEELFNPVTSME